MTGVPLRAMLALSVALAATLIAQEPVQRPVFRGAVDYVELDAVVTDSHDVHVTDLAKDDFVITEGGRQQRITNFQLVTIPAVHRTVPDVTTTGPSIDVVSNVRAPQARQWVLVIDDLHIIELHIVQTKQVVQTFLESLPPEDQVAIVFVGRSDLSQDFTSDLGAQLRTLNRIRDALGFARDASGPASFQDSRSTLTVLKNVTASVLRSTYPRKAMVYVSEGAVLSPDMMISERMGPAIPAMNAQQTYRELDETFKGAREAGLPIYTIDPRGIPDCSAVRGSCDYPPWPNIRKQQDVMRMVAENTGGLAFVNNSDITRAVHDIVTDNDSYYLLGYYPDPIAHDGTFHEVKVSVKRPGLRVRARDGYNAPSNANSKAKPSAASRPPTFDAMLGSSQPETGLALRAFAEPVVPSVRGMKTVVTVEVTYPAPTDGASISDDLQFGILALDREGKPKAITKRTLRFTGSPKGAPTVTYAIDDVIDLPSDLLTLRVGVSSPALSRAGTLAVPIEVPDLKNDALRIASVVIGLVGPPREAVMHADTIATLLPFQPTTTRTFERTDTLRVFAPLFWGTNEPSVDVTLSIADEHAVFSRAETVRAVAGTTRPHAILDTTLPLSNLTPGAHTLELTAHVGTRAPAIRRVAFVVK